MEESDRDIRPLRAQVYPTGGGWAWVIFDSSEHAGDFHIVMQSHPDPVWVYDTPEEAMASMKAMASRAAVRFVEFRHGLEE